MRKHTSSKYQKLVNRFRVPLTNIVKVHRILSIMQAYKHFFDLVVWNGRKHLESPKPIQCFIDTLFEHTKYGLFLNAGYPPCGFSCRLKDFQEIKAEIKDLNVTVTEFRW